MQARPADPFTQWWLLLQVAQFATEAQRKAERSDLALMERGPAANKTPQQQTATPEQRFKMSTCVHRCELARWQ